MLLPSALLLPSSGFAKCVHGEALQAANKNGYGNKKKEELGQYRGALLQYNYVTNLVQFFTRRKAWKNTREFRFGQNVTNVNQNGYGFFDWSPSLWFPLDACLVLLHVAAFD